MSRTELKEALGLLRSTLDCTFDGILVVDRHLHTRFYNRPFLEMWNVPEALLQNLDDGTALSFALEQMVHPEEFLSRTVALRAAPEAESHDVIELKDGRVLERYSRPHWRAGCVIGRVFTYRDITRRWRAEQAVQRSGQRLQALLNALPDSVVRMDRTGRILDAHWSQSGGFRPEQPGETLGEWLPADRACRLLRAAGEALDTGTLQSVEDELTVGADRRNYEANILPSGTDEVVVVVRDVTERKGAEERRKKKQRLESIGLLAGGMAHHYNNLLTRILGYASLLREESEGPAADSVAQIIRAAEEAARLTDQLTAYAGKRRILERNLDLSRAVCEAAAGLSPRAGIEIRLELASPLPPISGDPIDLAQAARNLLLNAIEALAGAARSEVVVRTEAVTVQTGFADALGEQIAAGRYALLTVSDSGCGMDETIRAHAFEPFFSTKFPGRGLGLAAVAGVMRIQRGGVQVESQPGRGSTFRLYFPVAR